MRMDKRGERCCVGGGRTKQGGGSLVRVEDEGKEESD